MSIPTVYVVYYSMYGHVERLAQEIMLGLKDAGVNAKLFQVAETLSEEEYKKYGGLPKRTDIPIITTEQLTEPDGILFGLPIRFGALPVQLKALFDSCGQLWMKNALYGKFVGTFLSGSGFGSGQETTVFSCLPFFAHQGMIYVPLGYKNQVLMNVDEIHGATPYGAGTLSGTASKKPSKLELDLARYQGLEFGKLLNRFKRN